MSSRSSYGSSSSTQEKGYARPSSSRSTSSYASSAASQSVYANSTSSRSYGSRYNSKPPVIHNGGGPTNDPNTSTSAGNSGYYK